METTTKLITIDTMPAGKLNDVLTVAKVVGDIRTHQEALNVANSLECSILEF